MMHSIDRTMACRVLHKMRAYGRVHRTKFEVNKSVWYTQLTDFGLIQINTRARKASLYSVLHILWTPVPMAKRIPAR